MGKWVSSQTHKAVFSLTPLSLPICSLDPYGFNLSRYWTSLAIGEEKIFPNASVPQCKVYVPWGKQHSTLLLECSTVKESVWDLALRFTNAKTLLGWADENTQALGPSYAQELAVKTQYMVTHGALRTDALKHKLPPETEDSVRLCHSTPLPPQNPRGRQGQSPWPITQPRDRKGQWGLWKEDQKALCAIVSQLRVFVQEEMTSTRNSFTTSIM